MREGAVMLDDDDDDAGGPLILVAPETPRRMAQPKPIAHKPRARPQRIDWFRVIVNLERSGCTQRDIAAKLGMSKGWVIHLKDSPGAEPRFDDGSALLDLWCDAMDKPLCDAPREKDVTYG